MATRIETSALLVPAGTPQSAPVQQNMTFTDGRVDAVEVIVPDGPSGLVGFQIGHSGQVIIPYDGVSFNVTDDEKIHWPLESFPEAQKWFIRAYNTGSYNHTLRFRWLITDVIMVATLPPLVPIGV